MRRLIWIGTPFVLIAAAAWFLLGPLARRSATPPAPNQTAAESLPGAVSNPTGAAAIVHPAPEPPGSWAAVGACVVLADRLVALPLDLARANPHFAVLLPDESLRTPIEATLVLPRQNLLVVRTDAPIPPAFLNPISPDPASFGDQVTIQPSCVADSGAFATTLEPNLNTVGRWMRFDAEAPLDPLFLGSPVLDADGWVVGITTKIKQEPVDPGSGGVGSFVTPLWRITATAAAGKPTPYSDWLAAPLSPEERAERLLADCLQGNTDTEGCRAETLAIDPDHAPARLLDFLATVRIGDPMKATADAYLAEHAEGAPELYHLIANFFAAGGESGLASYYRYQATVAMPPGQYSYWYLFAADEAAAAGRHGDAAMQRWAYLQNRPFDPAVAARFVLSCEAAERLDFATTRFGWFAPEEQEALLAELSGQGRDDLAPALTQPE